MTPAELYNYFTPLEAAIVSVLEAQEFTVWTPSTDPAFQKERPRVEAVIMPGAAMGFLLPDSARVCRSGFLREKARNASLHLLAITSAEIQIHRAYVARLLYAVDTLGFDMNETALMPYHAVQMVKCNGGGMNHNPEDGSFETTLTCDVHFGIKESAWADLET